MKTIATILNAAAEEAPALEALRSFRVPDELVMRLRSLARKHSNIMYRGYIDHQFANEGVWDEENETTFRKQYQVPEKLNFRGYGGGDLEIAKMNTETRINYALGRCMAYNTGIIDVHFKNDWAEPMGRGEATVFIQIRGTGKGYLPVF